MRKAWSVFGVYTYINPKHITTIHNHFILTLLNASFDFDVSIANDIAKSTLPGKMMQCGFFNHWKLALHNEIKWLMVSEVLTNITPGE